MLDPEDFPTLADLRARSRAEEQAMRSYLDTLRDEDLDRVVPYRSTRGVPFENVLWHLLAHVVNHGTQFRGEAGVALAERGASPGDLDLIVFLRERA